MIYNTFIESLFYPEKNNDETMEKNTFLSGDSVSKKPVTKEQECRKGRVVSVSLCWS